jgi:hypothetical protein
MTWPYASDVTLLYTGATGDGAPLNSATITYTVYAGHAIAGDGIAIPGGSGTIANTSANNYAVEIDAAITALMPVGGAYYVETLLVSGAFRRLTRTEITMKIDDGSS